MNISRNTFIVLYVMMIICVFGMLYFSIDFFTPTEQKCHDIFNNGKSLWMQIAIDRNWCIMNDTGIHLNNNWSWFNTYV